MPKRKYFAERHIAFPKEKVLEVLWDIQNFSTYEPKISQINIENLNQGIGTYFAKGNFGPWRWHGRFSLEQKSDGFDSRLLQLLEGPQGVAVFGGFRVSDLESDSTKVSHYEHFEFPWWSAPLMPFVDIYMKRGLQRELRDLEKEVAQRSS